MAKRFIDTGLFRKPSIRAMKAPYKALFIYLMCECDHAGVWDVELDIAAMRLGLKLDEEKAIEEMCGTVIPVDGGKKWWLVDFVEFQYGNLNPANRVHASVLARLTSLGIDLEKKGLISPLEGAKDKDMDKDKDTELEERTREEKPKPEPLTDQEKATRSASSDHPFASDEFRLAWYYFEQSRKASKHPMTPAARAMILRKLGAWPEATAIEALNNSTRNGWRDVFEPKPQRPDPTQERRSTTSDRNQPITIGQRRPLPNQA